MNFLNKLSILALVFVNFAAFGMEGGAAQEAAELTLDQQLNAQLLEAVKKTELEEEGQAAIVQEVEALLDQGADVNVIGQALTTPLTLAIWNNNIPLVKLLLARGADVSVGGVKSAAYEPGKEDIKKLIDEAEVQRAAKPVAAAAEPRRSWWKLWRK